MAMYWKRAFRGWIAEWTGIGGQHQVLYAGGDTLHALKRDGRQWQLAAQFRLVPGAMPDGLAFGRGASALAPAAFSRWIAQHHGDAFTFILDSADEEIEVEELPKVHGADRRKIIERRLRQRFRDAALTTWRVASAGRQAGKSAAPRRCNLMVGMRQHNPIHAWLDAALEGGARIETVESPALRPPVSSRMLHATRNVLLVSLHPAGLRQTLMVNGEASFTRLQPMELPAHWDRVADELERTVRFLLMSRPALRTELSQGALSIAIAPESIAFEPEAGDWPAQLSLREGILPIGWLAPARRLDRDGAGPHDEDRPLEAADLGALSHFLHARAHANYATRDLRRNFSVARVLAAVWRVAVFGLVGAMAANVFFEYALHDRMVAVNAASRMRALDESALQTRRMQDEIAALPVPAEEMRSVVELVDRLQSRHVDAPALLRWLGRGMAANPSIDLEQVRWEPLQPPVQTGAAPPAGAPPQPPAAAPAAPNAPAGNVAQTDAVRVHLEGSLDLSLGKEAANRATQELLVRLEAGCGCNGHVLVPPYDPSMNIAYSNTLHDGSRPQRPHFVIELEPPLGHAPVEAMPADAARALSQAGEPNHG